MIFRTGTYSENEDIRPLTSHYVCYLCFKGLGVNKEYTNFKQNFMAVE